MDVTKIDGDYIENLLNRLVDKYHMNWGLLSNLFGVEEYKLKNYKQYEYELFKNFEHWNSWTTKALMLDYMPSDLPDFRFKSYLELLIDGYKFSTKSIAELANIDEKYVIDLLYAKSNMPIETKYKLGSCITQLIVILKDSTPTY
ncbi:MAG: HTH domain-containing protein [Peptostreptococcaceae bacterium]